MTLRNLNGYGRLYLMIVAAASIVFCLIGALTGKLVFTYIGLVGVAVQLCFGFIPALQKKIR